MSSPSTRSGSIWVIPFLIIQLKIALLAQYRQPIKLLFLAVIIVSFATIARSQPLSSDVRLEVIIEIKDQRALFDITCEIERSCEVSFKAISVLFIAGENDLFSNIRSPFGRIVYSNGGSGFRVNYDKPAIDVPLYDQESEAYKVNGVKTQIGKISIRSSKVD